MINDKHNAIRSLELYDAKQQVSPSISKNVSLKEWSHFPNIWEIALLQQSELQSQGQNVQIGLERVASHSF